MDPSSLTRSRRLPPFEADFSSNVGITSILPVMASEESVTTADTTHESFTDIKLRHSNSSCESSLVGSSNQKQYGFPRSKSQYFQSGSILRSSSHHSFSLPPSATISFAPLPEISSRKRKPSVQLGVAARSRLLQQRRNMRMQDNDDDNDVPPKHIWRSPEAEAEDEGDPLAGFGQFVKGASKGLWKRISLKDIRALKSKTESGTLTGVRHAEEKSGEQLLVVDVGRGMQHTEGDKFGVWENVDAVQSPREDSATPRIQQ